MKWSERLYAAGVIVIVLSSVVSASQVIGNPETAQLQYAPLIIGVLCIAAGVLLEKIWRK